ncbi:DUF21 domain-containing protein [Candidatus Woesearchaeota archaeon]|nr:DUF21 domain-containing protein [Candidatus Woesearchaeota archaeon]
MTFVTYIIVVCILILSGLFSGLSLGLMSLDLFSLRRRVKLGNKAAMRVYPLRKKGNLLLITLLLGNVAVNSALALFLGSIVTGVVAGFMATGLIVIFGEIIPQAVFSRHALKFGAKITWIVWFFLILLYPISKPIALILDRALGGELPTIFSRKEFKLILKEQRKLETDVHKHEFEILEGGLEFSSMKVKSVMTPKINVFSLPKSAILNKELRKEIYKMGHSRIPVYGNTKNKVVGILYVKDLISVKINSNATAGEIMRHEVHTISEIHKLGTVLNLFKKKKMHLFIVHGKVSKFTGIVTLEDVLEEIVGEIVDEYDHRIDMRTGR